MSRRVRFYSLALGFLATGFCFVSRSFGADDSVGDLINTEKQSYQDWLDAADEPPAAFLSGDSSSAELYSPAFPSSDGLLCSSLEADELIELSGGDPQAPETALNLELPRVRDAIGESCLVRPGDRLVAVGRGWKLERTVSAMVVRREKAPCPDDSPYGLWGTLDEPLPEAPLFFTTDPALQPGSDFWIPKEGLEPSAFSAAGPTLNALVPIPEDYDLRAWKMPGVSTATLVLLVRRQIEDRDDGLPSVALGLAGPAGVTALWIERVDQTAGTGSFDVDGVFDFDSDGRFEIAISGFHQRCPYQTVLRDHGDGWAPLDIPLRPCVCR